MNSFYEHHKDSIRFHYRCFDRILLNGLIQPFQQPERVIGFFDAYRHLYPVSRSTLHGIADRFQQWGAVPRHAAGQGVSELALQTANTCSILFFGGDCIKNA